MEFSTLCGRNGTHGVSFLGAHVQRAGATNSVHRSCGLRRRCNCL